MLKHTVHCQVAGCAQVSQVEPHYGRCTTKHSSSWAAANSPATSRPMSTHSSVVPHTPDAPVCQIILKATPDAPCAAASSKQPKHKQAGCTAASKQLWMHPSVEASSKQLPDAPMFEASSQHPKHKQADSRKSLACREAAQAQSSLRRMSAA